MTRGNKKQTEFRDHPICWIGILGSGIIKLCINGCQRSFAVIFLIFTELSLVRKEEVTWAFGVDVSYMCISSAIPAFCSYWIQGRILMFLACLVCSLSIIICSFGKTFFYYKTVLGIFYGFGFGITLSAIPQIIDNQFLRYKNIAMGIVFCGSSIGGMFYVTFIEYLYETYALRGCFLILGGLSLHSLVGVILVWVPFWVEAEMTKDLTQSSKINEKLVQRRLSYKFKLYVDMLKETAHNVFQPMCILAYCYSYVYFTCSYLFMTLLVDYLKSKRITKDKILLIMSASPLPEMIAQIFIGVIAEKKIMNNSLILIIILFLLGIMHLSLPYIQTDSAVYSWSLIFGFINGSGNGPMHLVTSDFMKPKHLAASLRVMYSTNGILMLGRAGMAKRFQTETDGYNRLYQIEAMMCFLLSFIWSGIYYRDYMLKKRQKEASDENVLQVASSNAPIAEK